MLFRSQISQGKIFCFCNSQIKREKVLIDVQDLMTKHITIHKILEHKISQIMTLMEVGLILKRDLEVGCQVKSLTSEATHSSTPFFKRAYKISHPPRL